MSTCTNSQHIRCFNNIINNGPGSELGVSNHFACIGGGNQYAVFNNITNTAIGSQYGTYNQIVNNGTGSKYGQFNIMNGGTGNASVFGLYNDIVTSGSGAKYGTSTTFSGSGSGDLHGHFVNVNDTGSGDKYGISSSISPFSGGTQYSIYASATKARATNFAGYFLGNVGIGTTTGNTYTLPPSRGTNGQIMQTDAAGNVTWQNPNTALNSYAWTTTGNSGTTPATNYVGTSDNISLAFRTLATERMRLTNGGYFAVNTTTPFTGDMLSSYSTGSNYAVNGYATGTGAAGYFLNSGTGDSVIGLHSGTSRNAGRFTTSGGAANASPTLDIYNQTGTSQALLIRTDASNASADGIELDINGAAGKRGIDMYVDAATTGIGMTVFHDGTSRCINIQQQNAANTQPAFFASSAGIARIINAQSTTTTNTQAIGYFSQGSTGLVTGTYGNASAVYGISAGIRAGIFAAAGGSANTTTLQGTYSGAAGNYDGIGVLGIFAPAANYGYGVVGQGNWYGIYANGNSGATGTKSFQIDHPKDPENKYLRHYSMESPEVLNMYRGNIILDANGEATVTLPDYFDAININFSYHLTSIGAQANLYIKEEVKNNQFKIAGGNPNQKASWQVFAERNDLYIQKNPESKAVEVDKKIDDKGLYLKPELYNQPEEKGIFHRYQAQPSKVKNEKEEQPNQSKNTNQIKVKTERVKDSN